MSEPTDNLSLSDIAEPTSAAAAPDSKTQSEEDDLEKQERKAHIKGMIQDMDERKKYASYIFWLVVGWLICMFLLLFCQGFLSPWNLFQLSDEVLMAAIGGTTLNVIGIFLVVARYLFPRHTHRPPVTKVS